MAEIFDPLPRFETSLKWVPDKMANNCAICQRVFSFFNRRHHCRQCGNVVCSDCSPNTKKLILSDGFEVRVCNPCYTSVDEIFNAPEWSASTTSVQPASSAKCEQEGNRIGQLYIKIVEAVGLSSVDPLGCDPFAVLTLTGFTRHGQEWSKELHATQKTRYKTRTLNPRWDEIFMFNIYRPNSVVRIEIMNHARIGQKYKRLGHVMVPLSTLLDQRRHSRWYDLLIDQPEEENSKGRIPRTTWLKRSNSIERRVGRVHLLLHYKFSRVAEQLSHFGQEIEYQYDWPEFKPEIFYMNFWILLQGLWPFIRAFKGIRTILCWSRPSRSFSYCLLCVGCCLYIRWMPVMIHLALILCSLNQFFWYKLQGSLFLHSPTIADDEDVLMDESSSSLSYAEAFRLERMRERKKYEFPAGLRKLAKRMRSVRMDIETENCLQDVQNYMEWGACVLDRIARLYCWKEDPYAAAQQLMWLLSSCLLHIVMPNKYILLSAVLLAFMVQTTPFQAIFRFLVGIQHAFYSLMQQHQLCAIAREKEVLIHPSQKPTTSPVIGSIIHDPEIKESRVRTSSWASRKEELFGNAACEFSKQILEQKKKA